MTSRDLGEKFCRVRRRHKRRREGQRRVSAKRDDADGRTSRKLGDEEEKGVLDDFPIDGGLGHLVVVVGVDDHPVDDDDRELVCRGRKREDRRLECHQFASRSVFI